jgi:PAS domain S-box-containing protein
MFESHGGPLGDPWFRDVVEQVVAGIVALQDGRIAYANPQAAQMFGRSAESLVGLEFTALLEPSQRARHVQATRALLAGEHERAYNAYDVVLPSGATRHIAKESTRIELDGRPAVLAVLHDIAEQRRATEAWREDSALLRSLNVSLDEGVLQFDTHGRILAANRAAERLLGRDLETLRATDLREWRAVRIDGSDIAPEDLPVARTLGTGEPRRHELIGYRGGSAHEQPVWFETNVEPTRDDDRRITGAVVSFRDVTEERRVAEALRVSEGTNRTLMDALADGVFVAQGHRFVFANRTLPAMLGYEHDEFVGLPFARVIAPDMLALWTSRYDARVVEGDEPVNRYEVRFLRKNGSFIDLELVANRARFLDQPAVLGVLRDITERKAAAAELDLHRHRLEELVQERTHALEEAVAQLRRGERRLREANDALVKAEEFTRGIADNLPGRIAYWGADRRCRFANKAYCLWFGRRREELLGRSMSEIFGDRFSGDTDREGHVSGALAGVMQQFERHETSAAGQHAVSLVHYVPDVDGAGGQVRGFFVLTADITQAKRAQVDLKRLNDELVVARDRAEAAAQAKSAFLANMSHEIRTPMNVIIGLTHLMQRDTHDRQTSDRLVKVSEAAQHLLDIVNDVLDLSKIEAGKLSLAPAEFSVDALLARAQSMIAEAARRKGLALSVTRGDLPLMLRGDALRLSQVLLNLLSNAVKFTARGSVALRCEVVGRQGASWTVRFAVKDTGIGVPPERREQLFRPFEQVDSSATRRFGGTGLGLSIARELTQLMGGHIGVESSPGQGSTFWFTAMLEAASQQAVPSRAALQAAAGSESVERLLKESHGGARVLVADDNLVNQELATELLRIVDLQSDVAIDGRQAVEMAARGHYDAILMDMQMPEMDGLEATRRIRADPALDGTIIIAMTASAFGADRAACLAAGMNDHIGKPVHPAVLYDTLLRWLEHGRAQGSAAHAPAPAAAAAPPLAPSTAAPSPGTQAASDEEIFAALQSVPGLDLTRGLGFFAGRRALYLQALRHFTELYPEGLVATSAYLEQRADASRTLVRNEIHSAGGAAAALGAIELEDAATRIAALLREPSALGPSADGDAAVDEAGLRIALEAARLHMGTLLQRLRAALEHPASAGDAA